MKYGKIMMILVGFLQNWVIFGVNVGVHIPAWVASGNIKP